MNQQIESIVSSSDSPEEKSKELLSLIQSLDKSPTNVSQYVEFLKTVANIAYNQNVTKPVINAFSDYVGEQGVNVEFATQVFSQSLDVLVNMLVSYESEEMKMRQRLVELLMSDEEYKKAAQILQEGLNGQSRQLLTQDIKFETCVQIVRCYLELGAPELAEQPLSRAQHTRPFVTNIKAETDLAFKLCQARIYDSNRNFLQASNKYHLLSQEQVIDEGERLECLQQAIVCSILSPAGPLRGHALRRLFNDERSKQLPTREILQKVYLDRLLLPKDVQDFEQHLQPHQKAITADGTTVITKAVIEHNVMAVSKIYNNIGVTELGTFLGLEQDRAQEYTAKMIMQNRLNGKIDQVNGLIHFKSQLDDQNILNNDYDYANGDANGNGIVVLKQLDGDIQELCMDLEDIVTDLSKTHAEFVETRIQA